MVSKKVELAELRYSILPNTDVVAKQVRMGDGYFPIMNYKKPPFELPVLYQDDHFALGKDNMKATQDSSSKLIG